MLSNKSLKCAVLVTALLVSWVTVNAWSITDSYFGNKYGAFDARSFAMGSAGAYSDLNPFVITINPANLGLMKSNVGAQIGMNMTRNEDNRAVPLYNSFDNYVDDAVYSSNTNIYDDFAGVLFGTLADRSKRIGLGVYYKPYLSFDADYREEVRNNYGTDNDIYPEIIALNQIKNRGTVDQLGLVYSMGFSPAEYVDINLGLDYSMLKGDLDKTSSILWTDRAREIVSAVNSNFKLPDQTQFTESTLEGNLIKYGAAIQFNKRFGVGFTYSPKANFTDKGSITINNTASTVADSLFLELAYDGKYVIPSEMRIGFNYKPQNIMRTWLNFDVEQVNWSEIDAAFDDVINLYVGVEHHVENRYPLRLGFQAVNNWIFNLEDQVIDGEISTVTIAHKILTPMITAGSSIELMKNIKLDLGFGYAWREYQALDLFGDSFYNDRIHTGHSTALLWRNPQYLNLSDRGWENPDKVRESFVTLSTGLSFTW